MPVERLEIGDLIDTKDHGPREICWIGSRTLTKSELVATPKICPVRIKAGALGRGVPQRDLVVSPQHRILVRSAIAERMFGNPEVLVAAKHLLALEGISVVSPDPSDIDNIGSRSSTTSKRFA